MYRLPASIAGQKDNPNRGSSALRRPTIAEMMVIVLCGVWLAGCVPAFLSKKNDSIPQPKIDQKEKLIKPTMAANTAEDTTDKVSAPEPQPYNSGIKEKPADAGRASANDSKEFSDLAEAFAGTTVHKEQGRDEGSKDKPQKVTIESEKDDARRVPSEKTDPVGKEKPSDPVSEEQEASDLAFKHHDHAKYVAEIRNKAIDQLNKERDVDFVRLCRNTTTDQWSLTMYRRAERSYSFTDYAWNEINLRWEKVFTSDKKPISGWKQHLDFSAAGKECKLLKGSDQK